MKIAEKDLQQKPLIKKLPPFKGVRGITTNGK
jgi:hypothetical protein